MAVKFGSLRTDQTRGKQAAEIRFLKCAAISRWWSRIAQRYSAALRTGWSGVRVPIGAENFSPNHRVQNGSGAHPASYPTGTRGSFPWLKRPGREADHSPPSSAEVKNAWSYTSTPHYAFIAWCLVKTQGQLYLYIYLYLYIGDDVKSEVNCAVSVTQLNSTD
jgi:hypothetical protein